jgi:hypothetical protein
MLGIPMIDYDVWTCYWHPEDVRLNCRSIMLRMNILLLNMAIVYILYKQGARTYGSPNAAARSREEFDHGCSREELILLGVERFMHHPVTHIID